MGKLLLASVTATNKTAGARSDKLAMILVCSRANFTCQVAMSKRAPWPSPLAFAIPNKVIPEWGQLAVYFEH
jgi:hypothetical protein